MTHTQIDDIVCETRLVPLSLRYREHSQCRCEAAVLRLFHRDTSVLYGACWIYRSASSCEGCMAYLKQAIPGWGSGGIACLEWRLTTSNQRADVARALLAAAISWLEAIGGIETLVLPLPFDGCRTGLAEQMLFPGEIACRLSPAPLHKPSPGSLMTPTFRTILQRQPTTRAPRRICEYPDSVPDAPWKASWDMVTKDVLVSLLESYLPPQVPFRSRSFGDLSGYFQPRPRKRMPLEEVLGAFKRGDTYVDALDVAICNVGSRRELSLGVGFDPAALTGRKAGRPSVWLTPNGWKTPLHKDSVDNILCVLYGQRTLTLFPPGAAEPLGMERFRPDSDSDFAVCPHDIEALSPTAVPRGLLTRGVCCSLRAGEAIYIPAGWGHEVVSDSVSIAAANWLETA